MYKESLKLNSKKTSNPIKNGTTFFKINLFIYLFIFGCVGSSFLCEGFFQLWQAGATLHRGAQSSHYRGLSCCGAQAQDAQAQQLWLTGLVVPWHVGSSQTRAQTHVPCISRQILNHCATGEAGATFLNRYVTKNICKWQINMKKCSPSLSLENCKLKQQDATTHQLGWLRTLIHCWQECKMLQLLWKTGWQFPTKEKQNPVLLSYDPATKLLGIYSNELKT